MVLVTAVCRARARVCVCVCARVVICINLLKPTGYGMHQQVEYFKICTLCPHCIYVFCICLRKTLTFATYIKKLACFYNRDEKCLQRGTDWTFK
jgi:hypothetical protein